MSDTNILHHRCQTAPLRASVHHSSCDVCRWHAVVVVPFSSFWTLYSFTIHVMKVLWQQGLYKIVVELGLYLFWTQLWFTELLSVGTGSWGVHHRENMLCLCITLMPQYQGFCFLWCILVITETKQWFSYDSLMILSTKLQWSEMCENSGVVWIKLGLSFRALEIVVSCLPILEEAFLCRACDWHSFHQTFEQSPVHS